MPAWVKAWWPAFLRLALLHREGTSQHPGPGGLGVLALQVQTPSFGVVILSQDVP